MEKVFEKDPKPLSYTRYLREIRQVIDNIHTGREDQYESFIEHIMEKENLETQISEKNSFKIFKTAKKMLEN
jgi:hypothetical protein